MFSNNEPRRKKLGSRIADRRRQQGMTGLNLARAMNERGFRWDTAQVSRIENGRRAVSAFALSALADALDTTSAELLGENDD